MLRHFGWLSTAIAILVSSCSLLSAFASAQSHGLPSGSDRFETPATQLLKSVFFDTNRAEQTFRLALGELAIGSAIMFEFRGLGDLSGDDLGSSLHITLVLEHGRVGIAELEASIELVQEDSDLPVEFRYDLVGDRMTFYLASEVLGSVVVRALSERGTLSVHGPRGAVESVSSFQADAALSQPMVVDAPRLEDYRELPEPWQNYFCVHYTMDDPRHAYGTVRGFGGAHIDSASVARLQAGAYGADGDAVDLNRIQRRRAGGIKESLAGLLPSARRLNLDVIWRPFGLTEYGVYRDQVYRVAMEMIRYQKDLSEFVYFQIGNEVNGLSSFDPYDLAEKARSRGIPTWEFFNSAENLRNYAELALAPAVQAIRRASADAYGDANQIKILSGSVANIFNTDSVAWAQQLLDYRFKGTVVSALEGKPVSDYLDVLTVHYPFAGSDPHQVLDTLRDRFVLTGKVDGVWITEEHGRRGNGPMAIMHRSAEFVRWIARHQLTSKQARLCWWGTQSEKRGGRPMDAIMLLGHLLGNRSIRMVYTKHAVGDVYTFVASVAGQSPWFVHIVTRNLADTRRPPKFMYRAPWVGDKAVVQAKWVSFSSDVRPVTRSVPARRVGDEWVIELDGPLAPVTLFYWPSG